MKKIAFFLASDTLVYLCKPILEKLFDKAEIYILFPRFTEERARETYEHLFPEYLSNISTEHYAFKQGIDYLVCANDWGAEIKLLIWWARKKSVTTVAIQESVVDLSINSDRYLFADVVFAQGQVSKDLLRRDNVIVTGNPRYENITFNKPVGKHALINCNFTYGVFEESRDQWIRDVTTALKKVGIEFKISKHPRDFSNLEGLEVYVIPSGAGVIHDQVKDAAFLITRFSSLIHESILMGRPVIYYNPHGEDMGYEFGADNESLFYCTDRIKLTTSISMIDNLNKDSLGYKKYTNTHLDAGVSVPSNKIIDILLSKKLTATTSKNLSVLKACLSLLKISVINR